MRVNKILLTGLAVMGIAGVGAAAQSNFQLHMYKVAQTDNLDKLDALGSDKADFYVRVWINGKDLGRSKNVSSDVGETDWVRNLMSADRYVKFRIRLMEDDGGLEEDDDHVDINPMSGKKDLEFTYDTHTGRISGDVNGRRGMNIHMAGEGDSDRGQLWFKID